jgi:hypothetical protein
VRTIYLCTGVQYALLMMREARQVGTILLALKFLGVLAFFAIVYLKSVICAAYNCQLAGVVEVNGSDAGVRVVGFESLRNKTCLAWILTEFTRLQAKNACDTYLGRPKVLYCVLDLFLLRKLGVPVGSGHCDLTLKLFRGSRQMRNEQDVIGYGARSSNWGSRR